MGRANRTQTPPRSRTPRTHTPRKRLPINRYQPDRIYRQVETGKNKKYLDPYCEAKSEINKYYAESTSSFLGASATYAVLDTKLGLTSQTLIDQGVPKQNIYAINMNNDDCVGLRQLGIRSERVQLERANITTDALWYDSETTFTGSPRYYFYPGLVADRFLANHTGKPGKKISFAITVSLRNKSKKAAYDGHGATVAVDQMRRLIAAHRYKIHNQYVNQYKSTQLFAKWDLEYCPSRACKPRPLRTWKNSPQLIGFPVELL
jgi:hypothetical protein